MHIEQLRDVRHAGLVWPSGVVEQSCLQHREGERDSFTLISRDVSRTERVLRPLCTALTASMK